MDYDDIARRIADDYPYSCIELWPLVEALGGDELRVRDVLDTAGPALQGRDIGAIAYMVRVSRREG